MGFNLDEYEDVASRIERFKELWPSGRIEAHVIDFNMEKGYVLMEARVYREHEDHVPAGIDLALEWRGKSPVSDKWFLENASSSAIGRALNLVIPAAEGLTLARPTRQDMEKVAPKIEPDPWAVRDPITIDQAMDTIADQLGGEMVKEPPLCLHGHRVKREGTKKNGEPYLGYMCPEKSKTAQCPAMWYVLRSDGKWEPQR
jgi:hypothetical protein